MSLAPLSLMPRAVLGLAKEVARHLLRRPVVGVAVAAHTDDDRWLLIRRGDTGGWALPGGTLEWGETLRGTFSRELLEEAGVTDPVFERVAGVYSRSDRDPRFHAVSILITARVGEPSRPPMNPLEIREVRLFRREELPRGLSLAQDDMLATALRGGEPELE